MSNKVPGKKKTRNLFGGETKIASAAALRDATARFIKITSDPAWKERANSHLPSVAGAAHAELSNVPMSARLRAHVEKSYDGHWPALDGCPVEYDGAGVVRFVQAAPAVQAFRDLIGNPETNPDLKAADRVVQFLVRAMISGGPEDRALVRRLHEVVNGVELRRRDTVQIIEGAIFRFKRAAEMEPQSDASTVLSFAKLLAHDRVRAGLGGELNEGAMRAELEAMTKVELLRRLFSVHDVQSLASIETRFLLVEPAQLEMLMSRASGGKIKAAGLAAKLSVQVDAFGDAPRDDHMTPGKRKEAVDRALKSATTSFTNAVKATGARRA